MQLPHTGTYLVLKHGATENTEEVLETQLYTLLDSAFQTHSIAKILAESKTHVLAMNLQ